MCFKRKSTKNKMWKRGVLQRFFPQSILSGFHGAKRSLEEVPETVPLASTAYCIADNASSATRGTILCCSFRWCYCARPHCLSTGHGRPATQTREWSLLERPNGLSDIATTQGERLSQFCPISCNAHDQSAERQASSAPSRVRTPDSVLGGST